jgi:type IV pilus assembly protein PilC
MIAAGESAGKMQESLEQVYNQMKKSHELTSRIRGALIYPAVIMTAMTGIGIEMVVFVLPKILVMFNDFNAELPLPTRILMGVVNFSEKYALLVALGLVAFVSFCIWLLRKPPVKYQVHAFLLKLPVFGIIMKKINIARFTLTLSSLLQSALPIIEAVKITAQVLGNVRYRESVLVMAEDLKKGSPLSETLAKYPMYFPPMVVQMIMVGEQSGQVDHMLSELSEYYGEEVDATMRNFSTIVEPVMILIMGVAVAGMAVAVIMPMYSLAQSF